MRISDWSSDVCSSDRAGVGEAVELEAPARARNRIVDTLAQDNAATLELDLQDGALAQAQRVAHRLGQRDLATFGHRRFHGEPPEHEVCKEFTYFKNHTQRSEEHTSEIQSLMRHSYA